MVSIVDDEFPMMLETEVEQNRESPHYGMPIPNCPPISVGFGLVPQIDGKASKAAGHDVFKDVEYVKLVAPGDKNSLYFQPADDRARKRFPRAYAAFKSRGEVPVEGTPINQWAVISRSTALTLRAAHIHTVEALAGIHDTHIDRMGFAGRDLRTKAQAWLADRAGSAATLKLAGEKEALAKQLEGMQAQLMAITATMTPEQKLAVEAKVAADTQIAAQAMSAKVSGIGSVDVEPSPAQAARRPRKAA